LIKPYYHDEQHGIIIYNGKSELVVPGLTENLFDSCVTDPPYGLKFMGKKWDYDVPSVALWREVFRVMKPGAFLLSFGGTRTFHRMVVNIEDAGFEIRDMIMWHYGSGFPKSLDMSKAIQGLFYREFLEGVFHSMGIAEGSQRNYSNSCRQCGEPLRNDVAGDQDEWPEQDGVLGHIRLSLPLSEIVEDISYRYKVSYDALFSRLSKQDSLRHKDEAGFLIGLVLIFSLCQTCFSQLTEDDSFGAEKTGGMDLSKINALPFLSDGAKFQILCHIFRMSPEPYNHYIEKLEDVKGWGTALKPACEPICVARKPLSERTVALNVLKWGTGGINVDGGRIGRMNIRFEAAEAAKAAKAQDGERKTKLICQGWAASPQT